MNVSAPREPLQFGQTVLVLRRLLARIRDVMASDGPAQTRLARIVQTIATDMAADVCSIYIRRAGDVLELFATQGLSPTAVRRTRLRIGEGLVGEIAATARPLASADAPSHPNFVYRPETGEEPFISLMGVPILRGGRVVGVLVIQNQQKRTYSEEEIEALQTIAMVLAELVANGRLITDEAITRQEGVPLQTRLEGARLSPGVGIGKAFFHKKRHVVRRVVAEDIRLEHERLHQAVEDMHGTLDDMLRDKIMGSGEHREVLETYRMIAQDVGWLRRIGEAINTGLTAEAAVQKVNDDIHARISKVSDSYLRERVQDLEDLAQRLLQHLVGAEDVLPLPKPSPEETVVLIARNMGPAQLIDYGRNHPTCVILEEGSANAHLAIVARSLGIPVIGQVRDASQAIEVGDMVIVDADHGQVIVRPSVDLLQLYRRSIADRRQKEAQYSQLRKLPAVTRDGTPIVLQINAGMLFDLQHFDELGVEGVGLFRTEIPFMAHSDLPGVENQRQLYSQIIHSTLGKRVVFRTLDVGGDKILPFWRAASDDNPSMGWRAIRVSEDRPAVLRHQLRALIRATAGSDLFVMFPMIAEIEEFRHARRLLDLELARQESMDGEPPRNVRVGAMLEVPALLLQLNELLDELDFLSIGTNDLLQFLFASDRGSYAVSERYDPLSPVVLRVLRSVFDTCRNKGVPVTVCGEMAGRPLEALALLGIGLRSLSVSPPEVGPIKALIRSVNVDELSSYVKTLAAGHQRSVRSHLTAFARDHDIVIGLDL